MLWDALHLSHLLLFSYFIFCNHSFSLQDFTIGHIFAEIPDPDWKDNNSDNKTYDSFYGLWRIIGLKLFYHREENEENIDEHKHCNWDLDESLHTAPIKLLNSIIHHKRDNQFDKPENDHEGKEGHSNPFWFLDAHKSENNKHEPL